VSACGWSPGGTRIDAISPPPLNVYADANLAPEATQQLPTTLRITVLARDSLLPIIAFVFQANYDWETQTGGTLIRSEDFLEYGKRGSYTEYYFDVEWVGPDNTDALVTALGAGGTSATVLRLALEQLKPWPY